MADLPTMEELIKAVGKLKAGKAGGSSGILPEMVKAACSDSDNWQGIALLDVVGKLVARVVQGRLQDLAEEVLPESQCGF